MDTWKNYRSGYGTEDAEWEKRLLWKPRGVNGGSE